MGADDFDPGDAGGAVHRVIDQMAEEMQQQWLDHVRFGTPYFIGWDLASGPEIVVRSHLTSGGWVRDRYFNDDKRPRNRYAADPSLWPKAWIQHDLLPVPVKDWNCPALERAIADSLEAWRR